MKNTTLCAAVLAVLYGCGGGGGGDDTVSPAASDPSTAPVADAGPDLTVNVGEVINLSGELSSDPNGDDLEFTWGLVGYPGEAEGYFEDTDTATPYLVNTRPGEYVVSLTVGDSSSNSAPDEVTVTVLDLGGLAPARPITSPEADFVSSFAQEYAKIRLRSPDSFRLESTPTVRSYENIGRPSQGAVTFRFSGLNAFGVRLEESALCPINWDGRGFWENTLDAASISWCYI